MNDKKYTKEKPNQIEYDDYLDKGPYKMGPWTSWIYRSDPRHLVFTLSRYKFASKIFSNKKSLIEFGGGDSFGAPILLQEVEKLDVLDFEPLVMENVNDFHDKDLLKKINYKIVDFTNNIEFDKKYDAALSLDVIEHINIDQEKIYMENIKKSLSDDGICLIGTPNKEASKFANPIAAQTHINLKTTNDLLKLSNDYFKNSFIFSMNDEVVHTGYHGMSHYIFVLGVGLK